MVPAVLQSVRVIVTHLEIVNHVEDPVVAVAGQHVQLDVQQNVRAVHLLILAQHPIVVLAVVEIQVVVAVVVAAMVSVTTHV